MVAKWQNLVARDHDGDKNGQRDENQAGRDYRGMTEQQRRIETNQEFLAAEFSLQTFTRLFGYRGEAIHNRFDHPGHQQHHRCGFHRQLKNALQVVTRQRANHQPHDEANGNRFTEGAEAFLNVIGAKVNTVKTRDLVDDGIHEDGNRP